MALIRAATFENGNLIDATDGYDSLSGSHSSDMSIDAVDPIVGTRSQKWERNTSTGSGGAYGRISWGSPNPTTWYWACYFRITRHHTQDANVTMFKNNSSLTAHRGSVALSPSGELVAHDTNGNELGRSTPLTLGTVYRLEWINDVANGAVFRLAVGNGTATVIGSGARNTSGAHHMRIGIQTGIFSGLVNPTYSIDEFRMDNAQVPVLPSLPAGDPDPPDITTGIEYLSPTDARIFWSALTGARRYGVEWSNNGGASWTVIDDIFDLFWIHVGRSLGQSYRYRIKAVVETGPNPEDEEETGYTDPIDDTAPETILDTPTGSAAGNPTATSIDVSWNAVTGATGYDIRYSTDETNWTIIEGVTSPYTHEDLQPGTTYYYQTRSESDTGLSEWSDTVSAATESGIPDIPTGLSAVVASSSRINVSWDSVVDADSYDLRHSLNDTDWTEVIGVISPYGHTGLTPETQHFYQIRAVNGFGESEWSTSVSDTTLTPPLDPPDTPTNLDATSINHQQIDVGWNEVNDADTYDVRRSLNDADWTLIEDVSNPYQDIWLDPETQYFYQVRAVNSAGSSDWSTSVNATTTETPSGATGSLVSRVSLGLGLGIG